MLKLKAMNLLKSFLKFSNLFFKMQNLPKTLWEVFSLEVLFLVLHVRVKNHREVLDFFNKASLAVKRENNVA